MTSQQWLSFCVAAVLFHSASVLAQTYPARPISMVVPVPPGGGADFMARLIAPRLADSLKQPVVVENRPGAGNVVGTDYVARAKPDGYTLMMANNSSHGVGQAFNPKLPFDTIRDFTPLSVVSTARNVMVTNAKLPVTSLKEFIELARARPGELNFGSAGAGTLSHLSGELFKYVTRTNIVHIPYKGVGPALTALAGNEIQFMYLPTTASMPLIKDGRLKALAITGLTRAEALPEVPTLDAQGVKGFETAAWNAIVGPANMPRPLVTQLNQELVKIARSAEFRQRIAVEGVESWGSTPEECAETISNELVKWTRLVKETGLSINDQK